MFVCLQLPNKADQDEKLGNHDQRIGKENGKFHALMACLAVFILGYSFMQCLDFPAPGLKCTYLKCTVKKKKKKRIALKAFKDMNL